MSILERISTGTVSRSLLVFAILLPTAVLGIYSYRLSANDLTNLTLERRTAIANLSGRLLQDRFDELVTLGLMATDNDAFRADVVAKKWDDAVSYLADFSEAEPAISIATVFDASGTLRSSTSDRGSVPSSGMYCRVVGS